MIEAFPRRPLAFLVHRNGSSQTGIATDTNTKIQFTTKVFDYGGAFDNVTNYRFQPKVPGLYQFFLNTLWALAMSENGRIAMIYKNGSPAAITAITNQSATDFLAANISVSALLALNGSSDYVEFYCSQSSGVNRDLYGVAEYTYAYGFLLT